MHHHRDRFACIAALAAACLAMPAAVLTNMWWGSVFSLLLFEAALKSIPEEWYESARVDGARAWYQFRHITLPALKYVTFLDLVYITLFTINTFGILFVLTFGGPGHTTEVLGLFMWKQAFPDTSQARDFPFKGIENARPETIQASKPRISPDKVPFDPRAAIKQIPEWDNLDRGWGAGK